MVPALQSSGFRNGNFDVVVFAAAAAAAAAATAAAEEELQCSIAVALQSLRWVSSTPFGIPFCLPVQF